MLKKILILFISFASVFQSTAQPFDSFLSLDGTDDYASGTLTTTIPNNSDFTIEAYFNVCSSGNFKIIDNRGSTAGVGVEISVNTSILPSIYIGTEGDDNTEAGYNYSGGSVTTSVWHHLALVHRHSDSMNFLYYDGDKLHEWKADINPVRSSLYIGRNDHSAGNFLRGYIDEIRLSNSVRYSGATYTVSTTEFTNDVNTLALYHFNEGRTATTFSDASANSSALTANAEAATFTTAILASDLTITAGNNTTLTGNNYAISYLWSPATDLSSTSTQTTIASPTADITYKLTVSDTNDCAVSDSVEITVTPATNTLDAADINQLKVYPVPAKGEITLDFEAGNEAELSVINSYGESVFEKIVLSGSKLDLSDLAEGVYEIRLRTKKGTSLKRIILY